MLLIKLLHIASILCILSTHSSRTTSCAQKTSDDGLKSWIDMFAFRKIDDDLVNKFVDESRKREYMAIFQEYQQKYSTPDFEDKHGRNLAVYLTTYMASGIVSEDLINQARMFLKMMLRADNRYTDMMYMDLVKSLWESLPPQSKAKSELESLCIRYMIKVAVERGADMIAYTKSLVFAGDHNGREHIMECDKKYAEGFAINTMEVRLIMDPKFIRNLCTLSGMNDSQVTVVMAELDKLARQYPLQAIFAGSQVRNALDFADFCEQTKQVKGTIFWGTMAHYVLGAIQYHTLIEQNPDFYNIMWSDEAVKSAAYFLAAMSFYRENDHQYCERVLKMFMSIEEEKLKMKCGPSIWAAMNEAITKAHAMQV